MTELTVINGRLRRKIEKLIKQRDTWHAKYKQLEAILEAFPHIRRRYEDFQSMKADLATRRALEGRVKEQAALIKKPLKEQENDNPK